MSIYQINDDTEVSFENADLQWAALYHDCGKVFTQVFHNAKGEPTEEAHYYNHENVGAYDCLCDYSKTLLTSVLINLHMKPYTWKLEKTKQKYKKLYLAVKEENESSSELISELMQKIMKYQEKYGELED